MNTNGLRMLTLIITCHWALFFLGNGLEKFFAPQPPPGFFEWSGSTEAYIENFPEYAHLFFIDRHGKKILKGPFGNREKQVKSWLEHVQLPKRKETVTSVILAAGVYELTVSFLFTFLLIFEVRKNKKGLLHYAAYSMALLLFMGLTVIDIIVFDRFEVIEHSIFFGVLLISFHTSNWLTKELKTEKVGLDLACGFLNKASKATKSTVAATLLFFIIGSTNTIKAQDEPLMKDSITLTSSSFVKGEMLFLVKTEDNQIIAVPVGQLDGFVDNTVKPIRSNSELKKGNKVKKLMVSFGIGLAMDVASIKLQKSLGIDSPRGLFSIRFNL